MTRSDTLTAGRAAAMARRRADSAACRQRVLNVLSTMRHAHTSLSDAEITRRARVNPQYLQRHRDLKAEAEAVRAFLAADVGRAAMATAERAQATLDLENRTLAEQNAQLRRDLTAAQAELRSLRVADLAGQICDGLVQRSHREGELDRLRRERDAALVAEQRVRADLQALRNVNQRLIVENSRLLADRSTAT